MHTNLNNHLCKEFKSFDLQQWANTSESKLPLDINELKPLLGFNEKLISYEEFNASYAPLVNLILQKYQTFVKKDTKQKTPFIIGVTGSVSVGKSTFSRILKKVLESYLEKTVQILNTDGFIYPLEYLQQHNLLMRKGFPESYDLEYLLEVLSNIRAGKFTYAPIYDHITYDRSEESLTIDNPDFIILEGLNVLQVSPDYQTSPLDFLNFSIYLDADNELLEKWYIKRFKSFRNNSFRDEKSYFKRYSDLTDQEAEEKAKFIWDTINAKNYVENVAPTKSRADLIITKGEKHDFIRFSLK
ncbi:type I pantothenate kinase [Psittacicella hinzii]|uniref:Pantothenate kinase n=1 Tax=Psittacicella hinzii TaxID=2028575 RepID=A0A3A1Y0H7_9GAMM|nr:type I pantothenate kinase [Psittacicella hinzii]RIY31095.1 type I pantothenate kinase [Psittacicella hinzii]